MNRKKFKKSYLILLCITLILSFLPYVIYAEESSKDSENIEETIQENTSNLESGISEENDGLIITDIPELPESGELFPIKATTKVAENDRLELYLDEKSGNIRVVNKISGKEWLGFPQLDTLTLPNNVKYIESPVHIKYTDGASISETYTLKDANTTFTTSNIENGVRIDFHLEDIGLSFGIEYTLTNDGFEVTIPFESIKEEGTVRLTSLKVLPFFHAVHKRTEGAVFVPDGSGALMISKEIHPQYFTEYSQPVYGPDHTFKTELGEVISEGFFQAFPNREFIALPVYGSYQEGTGFLAIITKGEESAYINATPSGIRNIPYYRSGNEFYYRKQDIMFIGSSGKIPFFQGKLIDGDRKVRFILLEDEDANYVGMAKTYRNYLIEKYDLEKQFSKEAPLHIQMLGGILRDEVLGSTFIDMTTFTQAQTIIDKYLQSGVKKLKITFKGWSKNGLYGNQPNHFPVEKKLGGEKDLKDLITYARSKGVDLSLDVNYVRPFHSGKGFSKSRDTIRGIDREVMMSPNFHISSRINNHDENFYLLKPEKVYNHASKEIDKLIDLGANSIHLSYIGNLLYSDLDPKHLATRNHTKEAWTSILERFNESFDQVSVDYGFAYTFGYIDVINNIPLDSSNFVYFDETIPFYQIVVHGLIPYTSHASNQRNDAKFEYLRSIEYGAEPIFEITYQPTNQLLRTMAVNIISSHFDYWFERSLEEYKEYEKIHEQIAGQFIIDHKKVQSNVYKTTFENGAAVIVNYNRKPVAVEGYTIEAESYLLIKGGER